MSESRDLPFAVWSWKLLAISVIAVVAASGIALLLIPQLSVRAAVRGGTIALLSMIVSRLLVAWWARSRRRN
jgi:hypothetical protein